MIEHLQSAIVNLQTARVESKITYQYMCRESDDSPPLVTFSQQVRLPEVKKFTAALSRVLGRLGVEGSQAEVSDAELRDWGGKLYDRLIPQKFARRLATEPDTAYLVLHLHPDLAVGLVVPVGEEHMYFAAMNSRSCKLTAVGFQYWRLVKEKHL